MDIAVIGMGTMGAPMARNLLKAGHSVVVNNRTRAREEALAEEGAVRADSPAAAAREVDIVLTCVSDTPDVERVLLDPDTGAINGLHDGGLVIDCSSIAPAATQKIAARFAEKGIGYVDDCIVIDGTMDAVEEEMMEYKDFCRARLVYAKNGPFSLDDWSSIKDQEAVSRARNRRFRKSKRTRGW